MASRPITENLGIAIGRLGRRSRICRTPSMRLTLKTTLIGIVSVLILLIASQAVTATMKSQDINAKAEELAVNWLPSIRVLGEIKYLVTRIRLYGSRIVLIPDATIRRDTTARLNEAVAQINQKFATYQAVIASPEERRIWDGFLEQWNMYLDGEKHVIDLIAASKDAEANALMNGPGARDFNNTLTALDLAIDFNNKGAARSIADAQASYTSAKFTTLMVAGIALLIGIGSVFTVLFRVIRPLQRMNQTMGVIAAGNLDAAIDYTSRRDEVGDMANALQVFKDNGLRVRDMEAEQKQGELRTIAGRKAEMQKLAREFEAAVGEIVDTVSSASTELEASAGTLTSSAERSQALTATVAGASEKASANVQSVAQATEEMAASVNEISRRVRESSDIAGQAVQQARTTNDRVGDLAQAAARIGDVVELINSIAGQTNLLALNATIEAARAGDAGRGFAVVAAEVKQLAEQTAKATGEISQQIASIQSATHESVTAIKDIGDTIARMSDIASVISAAVGQQGAATQEISRNVQQAAQGTRQVSSNITDVQRGASETGSASTQVLSAAQSLSRDSSRLKQEVSRFLNSVRAA
jgi:methyl-accepting chemotaxis protein